MKEQLQNYCNLLAEHNGGTFTFTMGKKFIRIIKNEVEAFCFVDYEGNLYKCDGWTKPAKGVRGHISKPLLECGQFYH